MKLGDRVKDKISRFQGIIIGRGEFLYEQPQALVASDSLTTEGLKRGNEWIEFERLELCEKTQIGLMK
jgi:hypothetical protein